MRVVVDRIQHALAVAVEQSRGARGPDVLDALEVRRQGGVAGGRERLRGRHPDLHAEPAVVLPGAGDPDALARLQVRERADQDDLVTVAVGVDDREAGLLARPAQPRYEDFALERRAGRALDHPSTERTASRMVPASR